MTNKDLFLPEFPTLKDFQKYVADLEKIRGFEKESVINECLRVGEEIGELFKAVRKSQGLSIDNNSNFSSVSEELADIFIYLLSISNRFNINLENAFIAKERKNYERIWKAEDIV